MEEAVYRVYKNGKPYTKKEAFQNIKTVYVKKGSASSIITTEASRLASTEYKRKNPGKRFWDLPAVEQDKLEAAAKAQFAVVKYVPEQPKDVYDSWKA